MLRETCFDLRHVIASVVVLAAVSACHPEPLPPQTQTPPSSPSPVQSVTDTPGSRVPVASATAPPHFSGGSIVIAGIGQPSREVTSLPSFIAGALYDSLLQVDPNDGSLKPGLADAWHASDDARTITFHMRSGVRWHDGQPLTAQDVVFTIKALSAPDVRMTPAADFGPLADVNAPDSQTVYLRLTEGYCPALTNIGTLKILPEHILGKYFPSPSNGGVLLAADQFIGSGPLVLKAWTPDAVSFTANASYWSGEPTIGDWTYRIFPNVATAQAALKAGQIDLLDMEAEQTIGLSPIAGVKTWTRPANQFFAMAINNENNILADARVRQALAFALDRPALAAELFGKDAPVLQTSMLPGFWASPSGIAQPAYDLARAKQLLSDAGWIDNDGDGILDKSGKPLRLTLWTMADDSIDEPLAFALRKMLAQAGFQVLLQLDERYGLLTRLFLDQFDLAVVPLNIPLDPDQHWYWQSSENKHGEGLNFVSYANPKVDDLLKRGNSVPGCDPKARGAIYAEAYRTIANDAPQVFLFAPPVHVDAVTKLLGPAPSSFAGDFWNINSWQIGP